MPHNDNAFKVMLRLQPQHFLNLLLPGAELLEVLPTELPRESLYADALLRVRFRGKIYIVLLEVQTASDALMFARILQYLSLVWLREQVAVLPIVLYLVENPHATVALAVRRPRWTNQHPALHRHQTVGATRRGLAGRRRECRPHLCPLAQRGDD